MAEPGAWNKTLLWSYSRGTWQYDLICALILAFIFLVPPASFRSKAARAAGDAAAPQVQKAPPADAGQPAREGGQQPQQD